MAGWLPVKWFARTLIVSNTFAFTKLFWEFSSEKRPRARSFDQTSPHLGNSVLGTLNWKLDMQSAGKVLRH